MSEPKPETLMESPAWETVELPHSGATHSLLHAVLRSELLQAEVHLYVDPTPQDGRYAWMVGQDALLVGDRAGSVEDAKLCARMTAIGAVLRGGLKRLLAPHLTPSYEPPAGTPLPGGWTQQQDIQPWWSARAAHLYLQVTTHLDGQCGWQVFDGAKLLKKGLAEGALQAATACEQAAREILSRPRLTWTPRFPGGVRWTVASVRDFHLQVIPLDERGAQVVDEALARRHKWVAFEGMDLLAQGSEDTREQAELAAEHVAYEAIGRQPRPDPMGNTPPGWTRHEEAPPSWSRQVEGTGLLLQVSQTLDSEFKWTVAAGLELFDMGTEPTAAKAALAAEASAKTY